MQKRKKQKLGLTIEEAKTALKKDGLRAHIGTKILDYNPKASGTWRIFYYETEDDGNGNGYFGKTGTLYLKRDWESNDIRLESYTSHKTSDNGEIMRKMNPKWNKSITNSSSINLTNEKAISWLCDPQEWIDYKVEGIANFVIGSPSVEMYMKAYNIWRGQGELLICDIANANGYKIGWTGSYTSEPYNTPDDYLQSGPNSIFTAKQYNCCWWLCSPGMDDRQNVVMLIVGNTYGGTRNAVRSQHTTETWGICPLVSIK